MFLMYAIIFLQFIKLFQKRCKITICVLVWNDYKRNRHLLHASRRKNVQRALRNLKQFF